MTVSVSSCSQDGPASRVAMDTSSLLLAFGPTLTFKAATPKFIFIVNSLWLWVLVVSFCSVKRELWYYHLSHDEVTRNGDHNTPNYPSLVSIHQALPFISQGGLLLMHSILLSRKKLIYQNADEQYKVTQ